MQLRGRKTKCLVIAACLVFGTGWFWCPKEAKKRWDMDGDGKISCREAYWNWITPVRKGHLAWKCVNDADDDGTACESRRGGGWHRKTLPEIPGEIGRVDRNRDGYISCGEAARAGRKWIKEEDPWYAYMHDADGNGIACE